MLFKVLFLSLAFYLNGSFTGLSPQYCVFYQIVSSVPVMVLLLTTSSGLVLCILLNCFFGTYWHWIFDWTVSSIVVVVSLLTITSILVVDPLLDGFFGTGYLFGTGTRYFISSVRTGIGSLTGLCPRY